MDYRLKYLFIMLMSCSNYGQATELPKSEQELMMLIEFLGEWQTEEGEWLDPNELQHDWQINTETPEKQEAEND